MVIDKIWVLQNLKHDVWEFYSFYGKSLGGDGGGGNSGLPSGALTS